MEYSLILDRELTTKRPTDGTIELIDLIQRSDGKWQINVRVSWRPGETFIVAHHNIKDIKLYSYAFSALRHIVADYHYLGRIGVWPTTTTLPKQYF